MSLRVVRTDQAAAAPAAAPPPAPDQPALPIFDLSAHAKELETALRAAREELRSANESVRVIRDEVRGRDVVDASRVVELERTNLRLVSENRELAEILAIREADLKQAVADRAAISESAIAVREAYAAVRGELDASKAAAERAEKALADAATFRADAEAEQAAARERYERLVADYRTSIRREIRETEQRAKEIAQEIDAIQSGRVWRLKHAVRRLLRR